MSFSLNPNMPILNTRITFSCVFECPQGEPNMKFTKELKEMVEEQLLAKMTIAATKYEQSLPTEQQIDFMSYLRTCDRIGHHFSPKNGNLRLFINIRTLDRLLPHINKFMEDPEVLKFEYHNETYSLHRLDHNDGKAQQAIVKGLSTCPDMFPSIQGKFLPTMFDIMKKRAWLSPTATLNSMDPRHHTRKGGKRCRHDQEWIISYTDTKTVPEHVFLDDNPWANDSNPIIIIPMRQRSMENRNDPRPTLLDYESKGKYLAAVTANLPQTKNGVGSHSNNHTTTPWYKQPEMRDSAVRDLASPPQSPQTFGTQEELQRNDTETQDALMTLTDQNNEVGMMSHKRVRQPKEKHGKHFALTAQKTGGSVEKLSPQKKGTVFKKFSVAPLSRHTSTMSSKEAQLEQAIKKAALRPTKRIARNNGIVAHPASEDHPPALSSEPPLDQQEKENNNSYVDTEKDHEGSPHLHNCVDEQKDCPSSPGGPGTDGTSTEDQSEMHIPPPSSLGDQARKEPLDTPATLNLHSP